MFCYVLLDCCNVGMHFKSGPCLCLHVWSPACLDPISLSSVWILSAWLYGEILKQPKPLKNKQNHSKTQQNIAKHIKTQQNLQFLICFYTFLIGFCMFYIGFYKLYIGVYRFYIGFYMRLFVFICFIYVFIGFIYIFISFILVFISFIQVSTFANRQQLVGGLISIRLGLRGGERAGIVLGRPLVLAIVRIRMLGLDSCAQIRLKTKVVSVLTPELFEIAPVSSPGVVLTDVP